MLRYIAGRLLQTVFILWAVASIAFLLTLLSGDPATLMIGEHWTAEQVAAFRDYMGFDRPLLVQYVEYLGRILQGDFGVSVRQQVPVTQLILERFPATAELTLAAFAIIIVVAIPVGVLSAVRRNSPADRIAMGGALLAQSVPTFWLGILFILVFGVTLRWLPISGRGSPLHLILPAITLATFSTARIARLVRSSMLDVLSHDYIRTARAKGLPPWKVNYGHALRNALIPVVTLLGLELGSLLGGALVTETVFAYPGIGRLTIQAIQARDLPLVQGVITFGAMLFVIANLLVDLSYSYLDPRIRNA
ncbi:MAG: peptide/nickel transport system permease protein [Rhodothermales bacterium]|jgi:peptide/nickel transport system permease protein